MKKLNVIVLGMLVCLAACGATPRTGAERQSLRQRAEATLSEMNTRAPGLRNVLDRAPAYAVFPSIGKGGAIVGGAYGKGVLYEGGRQTGFVQLQQASLGLQLGGMTFSEVIILRSPGEIAALKENRYDVGVGASVVALTAGAAVSALSDATVFVMPRGGLMADISVAGQRLKFEGG